MVSKHNAVGDGYYDPESGKVLKFNHLKRMFEGEDSKKYNVKAETEKYRKAIKTQIDSYVNDNFKQSKVRFVIYFIIFIYYYYYL